jgi:hypothetical protein
MIKNITKNEHDYELLRKEALEKINHFSRDRYFFMHSGFAHWMLNSPTDFSPHRSLEKVASPKPIQSELVEALANLIIY